MERANQEGLFARISAVVQEKVVPVASKFSQQRHLSAVSGGLMAVSPLTILGGIAMIISQPPVDPNMIEATNFFNKFLLAWKAWATANAELLAIPYNMTMGIISIYAVIAITIALADKYKMNKASTSIAALLSFLSIAAPLQAVNPQNPGALFMSANFLDAKGLFTAIIVSLITVEIVRFLNDKDIKIKMPDGVPPMVTASFESLIPIVINTLIFLGINIVFVSTLGYSLPAAIMKALTPFVVAVDSLPGVLLAVTLINFFWLFGIHGGSIVNSVVMPFATLNLIENARAVTLGEPVQHVFAGTLQIFFGNIGGSGAALSLVIAMLLVARSAQLKSVSRVGALPALFNISEPIVFATPLVLNPILAIPMLLVPAVNITIAYLAMSLGYIGKIYVNVPFTTPGGLNVFLATLDWKASVLWVLLVILGTIIYLPFVRAYDRMLLEGERAAQDS